MLTPGQKVPNIDLPLTIQGRFELSQQTPENFTMLVFYRGSHCPICRSYLEEIGARLDDFTARGISVFAISMDDEERARKVDEEWSTGDLPLVYDLTEENAREWGLYISEKREGSEEPEIFSEPGLFILRPDTSLFFAVTQSAPFTRPPLDQLLEGLDYAQKNDYPARGTLS
ncbi:peroxiredoxin-like family protein [Allopontixanthobacter sp.]|uniref:peroxiredoxin-like family protein n=1 Tax=Allopontixanthobacter sp. TaxID=2906452 RepID=UPI002ABACD6F|nr:peroxiredoxin-like family protein [Allopontixanthobacter sp.]MDZ4306665.1 peroxiredoxin-like family protein [Allopontixanthobacter sp.]